MFDSGSSRSRRHLVAAVVVVLGTAMLPVSAALAAPETGTVAAQGLSVTQLSGFATTRGAVRVGGELWDGVTVSPRTARAVTMQYRRAGTRAFKNAYTGTASARGVLTVGLRPPAAGSWQFRAVVPATTRATRVVSATRTVVASGHAARTSVTGFVTTGATIRPGATVTDNVVISPRGSRVVSVQARLPGSSTFVTQSRGASSSKGAFLAAYRPTSAGVWGFRLAVSASATARSVISPIRIITADDNPGTDQTPPGQVTRLTVSGLTNTTATLSWTNPADADFTGVVIRRATGGNAPGKVTDGIAVTDLATPGHTFTDNGLAPATQYSYAVFAHDGAPNYAAAANVTLTTAAAADTTAPRPVTGLKASSTTRGTVTLSWNNPSDADFTGAVIRRLAGKTAPTLTTGTLLTDTDATAKSYEDVSINPATPYTYAVFAHDAVPNYAAAAVTTTIPATVSMLSISPLGLPINTTNKLTVGTTFRFDASESLAADGTTLVSGKLDYGDGQTDDFADTFGPIDFWNTEHSYTSTGTKIVTLTVKDSGGNSDTTISTVNVADPVTATVSVTSGPAHVGVPVTFALDASTPVGTSLETYGLVFGGPESFHFVHDTAPPATQDVTFNIAGSYSVAFSVANDAGGYHARVITITVSP